MSSVAHCLSPSPEDTNALGSQMSQDDLELGYCTFHAFQALFFKTVHCIQPCRLLLEAIV